jgi:hypothetical protein
MQINEDLDAITSILYQTFEITPFKRDYDAAFGKIVNILYRYGITENPRNLRFRFTLCMQEFFDSIPSNGSISLSLFTLFCSVIGILKANELI